MRLNTPSTSLGANRTNGPAGGWVTSAIKSAQIVEFLKALHAHLKHRPMIVWDGAAQHKSCIVRDYLDNTNGSVQMTLLPGYSPELNPVEYLWAWLKRHALANFSPTRSANSKPLLATMRSAQHRSSIIVACWKQAEL